MTTVAVCERALSQDNSQQSKSGMNAQDAPAAFGEIVADTGNSCCYVFQDKDNNYWFSTNNGVCRFDGKTLTRFTTMDGLSHDQVGGIHQHASTGDILIGTNGGVSKFDGHRFITLPITQMKPPASLDSAGFFDAGWILNANDLWLTGAGGPLRYDGKTLYQLKFPKSPLEVARNLHPDDWSPYDVWTVYKDRKGHIWFGTGMLGVCRFDGKHVDWMFERHLTEFENGAWFGFRAIIEDRNGDFWFNSTQHRYKVEPHLPDGVAGQETGTLKYTRDQGMDLSGVDTTDRFIFYQSITEDNDGNLWMAPYAGGVWKYDGKKVTHYPMQDGKNNEITMFTIYKDNRGDMWVGTHKNGAYKFNGKAFERFAPPVEPGRIFVPRKNDPYFTPTGARTTPYMPKVIIRNIREDDAGNIWFATFGGPIRYDGKEFTNFSEEVGLATRRVFSLLQEERRSAIWFGSITGGATSYDGQSFRKITENDGLAGNDVMWIFEDRDGKIWFGTTKGVSRYDIKSGGFTNFTTKDGLIDNSVYAIAQDAAGRIWFGTQGGICSYDGKSFSNFADQVGRSFSNIRAMVVDRSGNLWFGGEGGAYRYDGKTLTEFTSKNGLLDDFVGSMIVDRAGNVWMGHPGAGRPGGASRYDCKSFTHFTQADGLNSGSVYAMFEDKAGNIWFGTVDAGACRYDGKTFTNFSATAP